MNIHLKIDLRPATQHILLCVCALLLASCGGGGSGGSGGSTPPPAAPAPILSRSATC